MTAVKVGAPSQTEQLVKKVVFVDKSGLGPQSIPDYFFLPNQNFRAYEPADKIVTSDRGATNSGKRIPAEMDYPSNSISCNGPMARYLMTARLFRFSGDHQSKSSNRVPFRIPIFQNYCNIDCRDNDDGMTVFLNFAVCLSVDVTGGHENAKLAVPKPRDQARHLPYPDGIGWREALGFECKINSDRRRSCPYHQ